MTVLIAEIFASVCTYGGAIIFCLGGVVAVMGVIVKLLHIIVMKIWDFDTLCKIAMELRKQGKIGRRKKDS